MINTGACRLNIIKSHHGKSDRFTRKPAGTPTTFDCACGRAVDVLDPHRLLSLPVVIVGVQSNPTGTSFLALLLGVLVQRPVKAPASVILMHVHILYPPHIGCAPVAPFKRDHQLCNDPALCILHSKASHDNDCSSWRDLAPCKFLTRSIDKTKVVNRHEGIIGQMSGREQRALEENALP
jgi:hypothetical protein